MIEHSFVHGSYVERGTPLGTATTTREEIDLHLSWIEIHECSECGWWIATCRMHGTEMFCKDCGVSF